MDLSQSQLDFVFILGSIVICILAVFTTVPENLDYVSVLLMGFTLLAGILGGFTTFLLSHMIGNTENKKIKKWIMNRIKSTGIILFLGFIFIIYAYSDLLADQLVSSFINAIIGILVIVFIFIRTLFLLNVKEKDVN